MATGASNCAALAANWANEVLGALHCPKVTNARNTLPVILEARWTNPVRRAQASIWAVAKNSVTFSTTPSHGSAIAVSFASLVDDNPMPSYHGGETAPSPTNSRAYLFSFMRMAFKAARTFNRWRPDGALIKRRVKHQTIPQKGANTKWAAAQKKTARWPPWASAKPGAKEFF